MKKRGFSLIELIIVISVIAAISAIVVPSLSGINAAAKSQASAAAADALTMAMVKYRLLNGSDTNWNNTASAGDPDAARYGLLVDYLDFSEDTWADYEEAYKATFSIPASLTDKVGYTGQ